MAAPLLQPETCDVLVVGGGVAGCSAAMGAFAAKAGTVLIERSERPGGKATHAMVGTVCGAYLRSTAMAPRITLGKWSRFIPEVLVDMGGPKPQRGDNGLWFQPYPMDLLGRLLEMDMITRACNLRLRTTVLECVRTESGFVVRTLGKEGERCLLAKCVVDATGNALITQLCGGELITEELYQSPSHVVHVNGLLHSSTQGVEATAYRALCRARDKGDARATEVKHIGVVHGSLCEGRAALKITLHKRIAQNDDIGALNGQSRAIALGMVQLLREGTDTFRNVTVDALAPELGVRTQQRPMGRELLTEEDVLNCRKPANGVAIGAWPIEHWGDGRGADMKWMPEEEYYLVPSGALSSPTIPGLYFAGRSISATEMAIASARVMGTCISTGFAAGVLASFSAMGKGEGEAIDMIRRENFPEWARP